MGEREKNKKETRLIKSFFGGSGTQEWHRLSALKQIQVVPGPEGAGY